MRKLFPLLTFVVGLLLVPVFGPFVGGMLFLIMLALMVLHYRRRRQTRNVMMVLLVLNRSEMGMTKIHPGRTALLRESNLSPHRQWAFVQGMAEKGLIKLEKAPPRHVPPDVTGIIVTITSTGQHWLERHQARLT